MKTSDDIISDLIRVTKELDLHSKPFPHNPFAFQGMPVYTITPKMIPIIQVRDDFKWLTDEARARINAKLIELVGCREECAVPKDKILMAYRSILARPETVSLLANIVA